MVDFERWTHLDINKALMVRGWIRASCKRDQVKSRGQCVAKLPLTLDVTSWHSSHDRSLKPVPDLVIYHQPGSSRLSPSLNVAQSRFSLPLPFCKQMYVKIPTAGHPSSLLSFLFPSPRPHPFLVILSPGARVHDRKRLTDRNADAMSCLDPSSSALTESPRCCRVFCPHHCLRLSHGILDT
jgi:hypothetical protein